RQSDSLRQWTGPERRARPRSRRELYIDAFRGLMALVMVQGHLNDALLSPAAKAGVLYQLQLVIHGSTAPGFLFASGFVAGLPRPRRLHRGTSGPVGAPGLSLLGVRPRGTGGGGGARPPGRGHAPASRPARGRRPPRRGRARRAGLARPRGVLGPLARLRLAPA